MATKIWFAIRQEEDDFVFASVSLSDTSCNRIAPEKHLCVHKIRDFSEEDDDGMYSCSAENSKGVTAKLLSMSDELEAETETEVRLIDKSRKIGFVDTLLLFLFAWCFEKEAIKTLTRYFGRPMIFRRFW